MSLLDIQGLERWLEEQAGKGLFPRLIREDFTRFERREPISAPRFRLEAANGKNLAEPERLELYQQAGWQYWGLVSELYFLFYTFDPAAPELHTDPVTRGISLEHLAGQVEKARKKTARLAAGPSGDSGRRNPPYLAYGPPAAPPLFS